MKATIESGLTVITAPEKIISGFYGGRDELAQELDWLLAFEMWRKSLCEPAAGEI